MKTLKLIAIVCTLAIQTAPSFAQEDDKSIRTLIGNDHKLDHGGWGAPAAAYTKMLGQDAMLVGLKGGWLIDHRLTIGIAGYGLVTEVNNAEYDAYLEERGTPYQGNSRFQTGYGGLLIEPVIAYSSPIHISLPIIIGAGGFTYTPNYNVYDHDSWSYPYYQEAAAYFVVEPGIDLELNVIPLLRLGLGASYRYTSDLQMEATPMDGLRGWNASMSIKIGSF